jgi:uncharacterized protein
MIFVDAGAWIALMDRRERRHPAALRQFRKIAEGQHGRMVTTDYVLDEAVTRLRSQADVSAVRELRSALTQSESLQIVWTPADRFWEAWQRLEGRPDKEWSLTDCLSFVTMEALGIRVAFAFDSDFAEAGFELLPGRADSSA